MKKSIALILTILFSLFCFACSEASFKNDSESKLVFEGIEKATSITYEACVEAIASEDKGYHIIIVRNDDKDFGNIDNSKGTIDENLKKHREMVREYYTKKNNDFVKKYKLAKQSNNIYCSEYTPFISLSFSSNNFSKGLYKLIVSLANSDEVNTIYLSRLEYSNTNG